MKKFILPLAALFVMASCGGEEAEATTDAAPEVDQEAVVEMEEATTEVEAGLEELETEVEEVGEEIDSLLNGI